MRYFLSISLLTFSLFAKEEVIPGRYIIGFKEGARSTDVLSSLPISEAREFKGRSSLVEVTLNGPLPRINRDEIDYIEPVYRIQHNIKAAPYIGEDQWGLDNSNNIDIDAPEAWEITQGSEDVVVAVLDSGVAFAHKYLKNNIWHNEAEIPDNGIDDDENGYVDDTIGWDFVYDDGYPIDGTHHGTHVAGIIAAHGKVLGVAPKTKIMPLRFIDGDGSSTTSDAVRAIYYAVDNGAKVMNNSWGGGTYSRAIDEAVKYANDNNVFFVVAACNKYDPDNGPFDCYPAKLNYPAVLSVASIMRNGKMNPYSNTGKWIHVNAPGADILSTGPGGNIYMNSGTSMAAPFVSGIVALMYAVNKDLTVEEVKEILLSTGRKLPQIQGYTKTGRLVNAVEAVNRALELVRH